MVEQVARLGRLRQDGEAAIDCALWIVLVRTGESEVDQHTVAEKLRDMTVVLANGLRADLLEGGHDPRKLLRIGTARELGEPDQVAEQDRQGSALALFELGLDG
jgi:hypothetical protein